jgi:hypothetical protein
MSWFCLYSATMYGPVPGIGRFTSLRNGVEAGTTVAKASFSRKPASGLSRLSVTVFAESSATTPRERSQRAGRRTHSAPPTMFSSNVAG